MSLLLAAVPQALQLAAAALTGPAAPVAPPPPTAGGSETTPDAPMTSSKGAAPPEKAARPWNQALTAAKAVAMLRRLQQQAKMASDRGVSQRRHEKYAHAHIAAGLAVYHNAG